MRNKKLTFACLALSIAGAAFQVGCGDDDNSNPSTPDTGIPDTGPASDGGTEAGQCNFNDFVTGLITNSTTATALPSKDLGETCTDNQTPFPATLFQ